MKQLDASQVARDPLRVDFVPTGQGKKHSTKRWSLFAVAALGIAIALAVLSDRVPADPTAPLVLQNAERAEPLARKTIRVATYNIRGGEGLDERTDLARTAESLGDLDFVALQEVHGTWPGFGPDSASTLGDSLGMSHIFVPTERRWARDHFGNGLLTRVPLKSMHRIVLPGTQDKKFRNAVLSTIELDGQTVRVLTTHIDRVQDHDSQLRAVIDLFLQLESPAMLMGDLNTFPDNADMKALLANPKISGFVGDETSANRHRDNSVDWIIFRGLKCVSHELRDNGASDHPTVCAELELAPQTE